MSDKITDIKNAKKADMKISEDDLEYLTKLEAQTNQYKIAMADMELEKIGLEQQMREHKEKLIAMIRENFAKKQTLTEKICEKNGIKENQAFTIDEDRNIIIKDLPQAAPANKT